MNKPIGYIYLTTFPEGSFKHIIDKVTPYYYGKRTKSTYDDKYFGSGTIVSRWFKKYCGRNSFTCQPSIAKAKGVKNTLLVWANTEEELNRLEAFFVNPNIGQPGCLNEQPVKLEGRILTKEEVSVISQIARRVYEERPELREQQSRVHKDLWRNPDYVQKTMSAIAESSTQPKEKERKLALIRWITTDPIILAKKVKANKDAVTEEFRQRMSQISRDIWQRQGMHEKYSNASKNRWTDPEYREKTLAAMYRALQDPDVIERRCVASAKSHLDLEIQARRTATLRQTTSTPEFKVKMSDIVKGKLWWNNGVKQVRSRDCPGENWVHGRLSFKKRRGGHWWTDGSVDVQSENCPGIGFRRDRKKRNSVVTNLMAGVTSGEFF